MARTCGYLAYLPLDGIDLSRLDFMSDLSSEDGIHPLRQSRREDACPYSIRRVGSVSFTGLVK